MPEIRTKEKLKTPITTLDRAAVLAKQIKSGAVRTKEQAESSIEPKEHNPAEYASDKMERYVNSITGSAVGRSKRIAKTFHPRAANPVNRPIRSVNKSAGKAARASAKTAKEAAKKLYYIIKAIIRGIRWLVTACVAAGSLALSVFLLICMIALLLCSSYGVFFSGEDTGTGMTMRTAVSQINADYTRAIEERKSSNVYDELKLEGTRAAWKEVLAVYAVKLNMDEYNPQEVTTMDVQKSAALRAVFWDMHTVTSYVTTRTETTIVSVNDGHGRVMPLEQVTTIRTLHIIVSHRSPENMADRYHFTAEQKEMLRELLSDEYSTMWSAVLYGIGSGSSDIVNVAREQLGNIGGHPYWSWYGFSSRVDWCCIFVSWCADQCGYIEQGVIPRYAVVDDGVNWFKERGQWLDGSSEPEPGMIIFFDWAYDGLGDGGDHTGIVEKVEGGMVYTIEGNSGDACREKSYPIGYYEIMGYGFYMANDYSESGDAAEQVWAYLKSYGYSDSVAAGIIGNMMRECGGDTLNLDWDAVGHYNGEEYYGLCQWCLSYTPSGFKGSSIREQCEYLQRTIRSAFANYGGNYGGITYSEFLKSDTRTAAIAFERVYERCGDYAKEDARRASNAEKVYNHFH